MPTMQTAVAPYNQNLTGQPVGPAVVDTRTDAQVAAANDPYAALRTLDAGTFVGRGEYGQPGFEWGLAEYGDGQAGTTFLDTLRGTPFESKYNRVQSLHGDRVGVTLQQPGKHKYDTMMAIYGRDPATGQWVLQNDPTQTPTREMSSTEYMQDNADIAGKFIATAAAMYYGGSALMGGAGGAPTAAAVQGGAGGGTGVYSGALAGSGGAAAAGGAGAGATNAALAESAVGTPGYGASSAGAGGGAGTVAGAAGGGTAGGTTAGGAGGGSTVGSGAWNGTNFTGATNAGASAMGAGDWISLIQLGAGLWASDQASSNASGATAAAAAVAQGQLQLSRDAFDWYRSTYANEAPLREGAATRQNAIADQQIRGMQFAVDQAQELDQYNRTTFRPVEQRLVQEATTYDTPERRAQAAASAAADVDMSANATRQANDRALARAGVAPGSARAQALAEDSAVRQAAARGGAMTGAARQVEQQGYARMADVANLGRGIATQQATQQQIATSSGSAGSSSAGQALQSATSGTPTMTQGFTTAMNGMSSAGNLFNSVASSQRQDDQMLLQGINGIGQWAGNRYGTSDKEKKSGTGRMADTAQALKEIERTPVHEGWTYKDDPQQRTRMGAMAQDINRVSGEDAAPGGKVVDLVSAQGRMAAAVQELSKRVRALEKVGA